MKSDPDKRSDAKKENFSSVFAGVCNRVCLCTFAGLCICVHVRYVFGMCVCGLCASERERESGFLRDLAPSNFGQGAETVRSHDKI